MRVADLVEIKLTKPDDFNIVVETLTRIGIPFQKARRLQQICFILHKRGRYFITHHKELQSLDGDEVDFTETDVARRNTIIALLQEWRLITVLSPERIVSPRVEPADIRILKHGEKHQWVLTPAYEIGRNKSKRGDTDAVIP